MISHHEKRSKRRLNNSGSHFSIAKKSLSPSFGATLTTSLFKAPCKNQQSGHDIKRRSLDPKTKDYSRNRATRVREDRKKENQYGLAAQNDQKLSALGQPNGQVQTSKKASASLKPVARSLQRFDDSLNKNIFRRARLARQSPPPRNRNPMKDSCSTESTRQRSSQEQILELNRLVKDLSKTSLQYKGLYERAQVRLESLEKQIRMEKTKQQRIKNMYRQRLNQMAQNQEAGKQTLGHIFTYREFPKDFIPDEVIVENSVDCEVETSRDEGEESKVSNLSLESH